MNYYLILPAGQIGPISQKELIDLVHSGQVTGVTMGRTEGTNTWIPLAAIETIQGLFPSVPFQNLTSSNTQNNEAVYATFGERFAASQIDGFIALALAAIGTAICMVFLNHPINFPVLLIVFFLNLMTFPCFYFAWMQSSRYQATVGKRIVEIYVARVNGRRVKFLRAMVRYWLMNFLSIFFWVMFLNPRRQMMHDIFTRTIVLKGKK